LTQAFFLLLFVRLLLQQLSRAFACSFHFSGSPAANHPQFLTKVVRDRAPPLAAARFSFPQAPLSGRFAGFTDSEFGGARFVPH